MTRYPDPNRPKRSGNCKELFRARRDMGRGELTFMWCCRKRTHLAIRDWGCVGLKHRDCPNKGNITDPFSVILEQKYWNMINLDSWREHPMMSVCGCIDSYGAITARASDHISVHQKCEMSGKRWRWIIHEQQFHSLPPRTIDESNNRRSLQLNDEEYFLVCNWLIEHGFADERILPKISLDNEKRLC